MKKILSLSLAAAMAVGFAACSSEDAPVASSQDSDSGNGAYVQFQVALPSTGDTRTTDSEASALETSGVYATGFENEYKVYSVYAYFFDSNDQLVTLTKNRQYATYTVSETSSSADVTEANNLGEKYKTAVQELDANLHLGQTYKVYLLCNKAPTTTINTVSDLLNSTMDFENSQSLAANVKEGIPMAARSIDGTVYETLTPAKTHTQSSPAELNFEVERSYARIAFANESVTDIPLYAKVGDTEQIGTITVKSYYIVNKSNEFYTYRHVGTIDETSFAATPATGAAAFGRITSTNDYVIDPNTSAKKASPLCTDFLQPLSEIGDNLSNFRAVSPKSQGQVSTFEYVPENVMGVAAQKKGQATGVYFEVALHPNTSHVVGNSNADGSLFYYNGMFYRNISDVQAVLGSAVTAKNYADYGVKYYKGGYAYYEYFIRHNDNGDYSTMGHMEFAIVRNNAYDLNVKSAIMAPYGTIGDPTDPNPTDPDTPAPDPNDPDPEDNVETAKMYLQIDVVVRPWVLRSTDVVLGQ
jgi:hypothetical protein